MTAAIRSVLRNIAKDEKAKEMERVPEGYIQVGEKIIPTDEYATEAVRVLLRFMEVDPSSKGLIDTPKRVLRALREMTAGYLDDPKEILNRSFEEDYDEVVILKNIPFTSLCEHHLLTFSGSANVGYIPQDGGPVVGLSKLARLVDCFARRLQVQERMTKQIATALDEILTPKGVAVTVKATHSCMSCRGVKKPGSEMVTSVMLGAFRTDASARLEFLELCKT